MTETGLADLYRAYIACLNRQDWPNLHRFVADDARHNGRPFGLAGYRAMLERDFEEIPDLQFNIELLGLRPAPCREPAPVRLPAEGPVSRSAGQRQAGRLRRERLLSFPRRKIAEVWSVVDKAAIEAQL